ncbi:hypothetical protein XPA_007166 [Xanthoria parietina]
MLILTTQKSHGEKHIESFHLSTEAYNSLSWIRGKMHVLIADPSQNRSRIIYPSSYAWMQYFVSSSTTWARLFAALIRAKGNRSWPIVRANIRNVKAILDGSGCNVPRIDAAFAQQLNVPTSTGERYSLLFILSNWLLAIISQLISFIDGREPGCPDAAREVNTVVIRIRPSPYD